MNLSQRLEKFRSRIAERLSQQQDETGWLSKRDLASPELATALSLPGLMPIVEDTLNQLKAEVEEIMRDNRLTFSEVIQFSVRAIKILHTELSQFTTLDAVQRKNVVLLALDEFYGKVIAPLDIPYVPKWLENSLVDPQLGKLWHSGAESLYDAVESLITAN